MSGQEYLLEGWVGSIGYPRGQAGIGRPSRRARSGREALPEGWEESEVLQEGQEQ